MKTRFTLLLLLISILCGAQDKIKFNYSPGNFAYFGIENHFEYNIKDKYPRLFTCPIGEIIQKNGILTFKASVIDTSEIKVYKIQGKDTLLEYTQKIIVRKVNDPTIAINKIEIKEASYQSIFENAVYLEGLCDVDIEPIRNGFFVESFLLRIISSKQNISFKSNNKMFTAEMKKAIHNLKSGDQLWFEKVILKGPDGTTRYLGHIVKTTIK